MRILALCVAVHGIIKSAGLVLCAMEAVSAEITSLNDQIGQKYLVEKIISSGGMGSVYQALDQKLRRRVAIKVPHRRVLSEDEQHGRRVHLEALIAANLQHPNIVQVYELLNDGGAPQIVMEFVEGLPLSHVVRTGELKTARVVEVMIAVCEAIDYAHSRGVIHRDLKPSNILLTGDGTPKVSDFGIAQNLDPEFEEQQIEEDEDTLFGTPSFVAPEQVNNKNSSIDNRVDVFSLGATLYYGLTKQPPFVGGSLYEILAKVVNGDYVEASELRPGLAPELNSICVKALQSKPDDRYNSAGEMARDLYAFLHQQPVRAHSYRWREKAQLAIAARKSSFVSSVTAFLMVVGVFLFSVFRLHHVSMESLTAQLRDEMRSLASTASLLIDPELVGAIKGPEQARSPEAKALSKTLRNIQDKHAHVKYAYLYRYSLTSGGDLEVVVEGDSFAAFKALDQNKNGELDRLEQPMFTGDILEEAPKFPDMYDGLDFPTADEDIIEPDKWDISLSGYAPIKDKNKKSLAAIGLDMSSADVHERFKRIDHAFYTILTLSLIITVLGVFMLVEANIILWERSRKR